MIKPPKIVLLVIEFIRNDQSYFILNADPYVKGYNFISKPIGSREKPLDAAIEALKKHLTLPEKEYQKLSQIEGPFEDKAFILPNNRGENAVIYLYRIKLDNKPSSQTLKYFSASELVEEAWKNPDNTYIRFVLKNDIIKFPEPEKLSLPFVFNIPALEYYLQKQVEVYFKNVLGLGSTEAVDIHLHQIDTDDLGFLIRTNQTLKTRLDIYWTGSNEIFTTDIPVPYHGVFIIHSNREAQSNKWVWRPCLMGKPGEWIIKKYHSDGEKTSLWHRWVLDRDQYWELPLSEEITKKHEDRLKISGLVNYSNGTKIATKKHEITLKNEFIEKTKAVDQSNIKIYDEQDIGYQRLLTFSSYFLENFLKAILKSGNEIIEHINSSEPTDNNEQVKIWESIIAIQKKIGNRLFPFRRLQKRGLLQNFTPLNSVDAISQLMSFQRYANSPTVLHNLQPIFRQNHPSFKGYICPVETPESFEVGLTLHLARGIKTDAFGSMYNDPDNKSDLGYSASLVPFYQYNDAARAMMGAKNLKQALPLTNGTEPWITTGNETQIYPAIKPLIDKQVVPEYFNSFKLGVNLLVAYMPWYGWNFEDAIVANKELAENDTLSWDFEEEYTAYIKPGFKPCAPGKDNYLPHIGEAITPETAVAYFKKDDKVFSIPCGGKFSGILSEVDYIKPKYDHLGGLIKWKIIVHNPLHIGDKLMARYGNKGVVSTLLPGDELPHLSDDARLPEELRGRAVDLVLNPHGVISRMNLGQLLETHYGLAKALGERIPDNAGQPFTPIDTRLLSDNLIIDGVIDKYGKMYLTLPDGTRTESPVVVGYQYFLRLNHLPEHKINVRAGGSRTDRYNIITGQPVAGKIHNGGQRIGEMEMWALAAHQADKIMKNILEINSDPYFRNSSNKDVNQTFLAIKDHLFAIGINLTKNSNCYRTTLVTSEDILSQCGQLQTSDTKIVATRGKMICPIEGCKFQLLKGKPICATGSSQRSDDFNVTVGDLIQYHGYEIDQEILEKIPKPEEKKEIILDIPVKVSGGNLSEITLNFSRKGRTVNLDFKINGDSYHAYSQVDGEYDVKTFPTLKLTCDKHRSNNLICQNPKPFPKYVKGGLFDPEIFGEEGVRKYSDSRWGYIKLPFTLKNPLFDGSDHSHEINILPVLPSKYRSTNAGFYLKQNGIENKITRKYIDIFNLIKRYKKGNEDADKLQRSINIIVKILFNEIKDRLFGTKGNSKYGLIRRHGLGRRVDYSGRLVITPDPNLGWDECGVPAEVLFVLLKDKISPSKHTDAQYEVVSDYLSNNPETRVLLNRAPTLHKYNILSFKPVTLRPEEGVVLKINPLVCKPFGADFDGDQMAIHMLLDGETTEEAKSLSPVHKSNLLSVANGKPVLDFDQDFVLGHYLQSRENKSAGIETITQVLQNPDSNVADMIPEMMRGSFEAVTRKGISFGFLELEACALDKQEKLSVFADCSVTEVNNKLETKVEQKLIESSSDSSNPGYSFAVMALSGARGKKQTRQIIASRGLLQPGAVGFETKEADFIFKESLLEGMSPETSFLAAMNARSSMVDKHMGTAEAGSLYHKLILALWSWHIIQGDCGKHSLLDCNHTSKKQICSSCYGTVFGYDQIPDDYPAGLIAAQSFGERGTQLSMQSFHTGEKVISLGGVTGLLGNQTNKAIFKEGNCEKFVAQIRNIDAYCDLDIRHIQILWLAIKTSPKKSLSSAGEGNMTPLSFRNITKILFEKPDLRYYSPTEKLLSGSSPVKFRQD